MSTRDYSSEQEKHIANVTGGKIVANSGGTRFGGGDVHTNKFLIEAKTPTTPKESFRIKKDWIMKSREQAFEQGKPFSALAFQFEPKGENFYVINEHNFLDLLLHLEKEN